MTTNWDLAAVVFLSVFEVKFDLELETSFHSTLLTNHQEEGDMLSYFIPTQSIPLYPFPFHLFASSTSSLPSESTLRPCSFAQHIIQSAAQHIFVFVFEVVFEAPAAHTCHFFRPLLQMLWVGFIISLNKSHSPLNMSYLIFSSGILSYPPTNCVFIIYYEATANSNSLFIIIILLYIFGPNWCLEVKTLDAQQRPNIFGAVGNSALTEK